MALVSQSIKNLKGGISQQPDILRYQDQGAVQINGWSSEIEGLQKRPPLLFTKALGGATYLGSKPYVHLINRDEFEQYMVVFTGSTPAIRVFDLNGREYTVRGNLGYVTTPNPRDDLRMVTVADYTFIVNRKTVVQQHTAVSNGGTFRDNGDCLINVRGGQYGRTLSIHINGGTQASYQIPDGSQAEHVKNTDAQFLAEELAKQLRTNLGSTWGVAVGQGFIHIAAPSGSAINTVTTKDGYADQLISPVTHYAQSFSKLPLNAPNGYMVKIVGDSASTSDQYYVTYDLSRKVWRETVGWNQKIQMTNASMPWTLVRAADGNFDFKEASWGARTSGDTETSPWPSFVGSTINDVFFFRNRLGFLSGENVIMSKTTRYFDFFPASVATLSDDDPIDVAVSHNRISILKYAVPFSEELLLWSDEAQFVMGAQGVLSSKTIELDLTTQFDVQDKARPYGIGRNVYFPSKRASFTSLMRYYAVQDVSAVKNAEDMTAHVPSYIPNGVYNVHGSSAENFCSVLTDGAPSRIYMYKFLYLDEEIKQQSWSHWDFGSNVTVYAAYTIGSQMFVLMNNGVNTFMCSLLFTKNTNDISGEPYRIYSDVKVKYTIPAGTYNDDLFQTKVSLQQVYGMGFMYGTISVVEPDGKITEHEQPLGSWQTDPYLYFDGNLEGVTIFIGFNFKFQYEFSRFLIKQTAEDGSQSTEDIGRLQLRRAWVNYEQSGAFTIGVDNQGRVYAYEMAGGRLGSNALRVNRLNLGTGQFRFPVVGNAKYNVVTITSENTTPLSIIGCGWEGNYIRRSNGI